MGRFRKALAEEKRNMPAYQYKLEIGMLVGLIYVLGGALLSFTISVIIGVMVGESIWVYVPVIVWGVGLLVFLVLLVIYAPKVKKWLIRDKTIELNEKYPLVTEKTEIENPFIKDGKVILKEDDFCMIEDAFVFEEECELNIKDYISYFHAKTLGGVFYFSIRFFNHEGYYVANTDLTKDLYFYFANNMDLVANKKVFKLFVEDKKEFLKLLYKYNDDAKMEKTLDKKEG